MKYDRRAIMNNAWDIRRESGCTMSVALKKAWAVAKEDNMKELTLAPMTGSEKQIAWANNIITEPYDTVASLAESNAKKFAEYPAKDFNLRATIYREAAEMYADEYKKAAHLITNAAQVIDTRSSFKGMMNEMIRQIALKHGATVTDIYRI